MEAPLFFIFLPSFSSLQSMGIFHQLSANCANDEKVSRTELATEAAAAVDILEMKLMCQR